MVSHAASLCRENGGWWRKIKDGSHRGYCRQTQGNR
jgi:hypothetical protein